MEYRLAGYVRAIQRLSTADGTNEPFPTDTGMLKDVVRGGTSVSQGGREREIVSGSEQAAYHAIRYLYCMCIYVYMCIHII